MMKRRYSHDSIYWLSICNIQKSLTKNIKCVKKKCCAIFKTFKVQNYFSLKDESPLALQAYAVYLFEGSCDKNQIYICKTNRQLAATVRKHLSGNSTILNICLPSTHVIILPFKIFIFCHMVVMILIIK